jgi:hypothetical protein
MNGTVIAPRVACSRRYTSRRLAARVAVPTSTRERITRVEYRDERVYTVVGLFAAAGLLHPFGGLWPF